MSYPECWVLLRGLGREARHWGVFPQRLASALGDVQIITPDLPGNGERFRERSGISIAEQLNGLRRSLALERPVQVVALSLGGMLAMEWASRYPQEIKSLVLINSSLSALSPFWQRLRFSQYHKLIALLWRSLPARERLLLALTANDPVAAQAAEADWIHWQQHAPVSLMNLLRQLCAAARYSAPSPWPECPGLIVTSTQDRVVNTRCSQAIAERGAWPLHSHASAGHDVPLDDPDWLAEIIALWSGTLRQV